jgi:hypothetical protein
LYLLCEFFSAEFEKALFSIQNTVDFLDQRIGGARETHVDNLYLSFGGPIRR